jgi:hypothetical protein
MLAGDSAGTAAALAAGGDVHAVDVGRLQQQLRAQGQIL